MDSRGIIAARTNGLRVEDVNLYNFKKDMILLQSCSECFTVKLWVTGSKNTHFLRVKAFDSDEAKFIFWENHRREIFWDEDGSLTNINGGA